MLDAMNSNRFLPVLLAVTLLLGDRCALRFAQGHFWPEPAVLFVVALFTSQLALLTTAAVLYRGLFLLRAAAVVALTLCWCRWGSSLVGGMPEWTAMATMIALPLAVVLLVARTFIERKANENGTISHSALGLGELLTTMAVVAMVFATIRAVVESPLDHQALTLALLSSLYSMAMALAILSPRFNTSHLLLLVPLTLIAGYALHAAGGWSLESTCLWSAMHGLLLAAALCVLRAGGLRVGPPKFSPEILDSNDATTPQDVLARA